MASPAIVTSNINQGELGFVGPDGRLTKFQIVGFIIDGGTATPITWPAVPSKSEVFIRSSAGFQRFDLSSGLASGPQTLTISGAKA